MKGLILKDLYNAMTQGKALLFMVVIFGVCFANAAEEIGRASCRERV